MFLTVHATVGAALTQSVPNPWIAFLLGFISHFAVDLIPHGDQNLIASNVPHRKRVQRLIMITFFDLAIISVLATYWYTQRVVHYPFSVAAGMFGALVPDGLQGITELTHGRLFARYKRLHDFFHINVHKRFAHATLPFVVGLSLQIIVWYIAQRSIGNF